MPRNVSLSAQTAQKEVFMFQKYSKKGWWVDKDFRDLIAITREETLPKHKKDLAWQEIFEKYLIPLTKQVLRNWNKKDTDPWVASMQAWQTIKALDLERPTSSYSFCLNSIQRSLGEAVRNDENWSESKMMPIVQHSEKGNAEPPDGWFVVGTRKKKDLYFSTLAPYNHRVDPERDREIIGDREFRKTEHDDPLENADRFLGEDSGAPRLATAPMSLDDGAITPDDLLDVRPDDISRACGEMDWLSEVAWDYLQQIIKNVTVGTRAYAAQLPDWTKMRQSSVCWYGVTLNRDDQALVIAIIGKAIRLAREQR